MASYKQAVAAGQQSGQTGSVVPSGGSGGKISYRFVPSGGASGGAASGSGNMSQLFMEDRAKADQGRTDALSKFDEALKLLSSESGDETGRQAMAAAESNFVGRGLSNTSLPAALSAGMTADIAGKRKNSRVSLLAQLAQMLANTGNPTTVTPGAVTSANSVSAPRVMSSGSNRKPLPSLLGPGGGGGATPLPPPTGGGSGSIFDAPLFANSGGGGSFTPEFKPFTSAERSEAETNLGSMGGIPDILNLPNFANDPLDLTGFNF